MTDRATVAVVAYDDQDTLERCVRSLRSTIRVPILIVDNHSKDKTSTIAAALASELPRVSAIHTDENGGYAAAGNIARSKVATEYLAIMNADCTSTGDWVSPMIAYLDDNPGTAAVSPTLGLNGRDALNAEGLDIHKAGFGFNRHLGRPMEEAAISPGPVPGIQGTAFIIRLAALDAIGGWYSGGFLYHEDVELSWSLRLAGYDISHIPTPPLMHDYELTMSPEKFFLLERNRLEMLSVNLSPATKMVLAPVVLATEIAVWLYALRKGSALAYAKLRSYRGLVARGSIRKVRRREVRAFRRISDRELMRATHWRYPRSQTRALHRDPTTSGRRGDREMPTP
jgi:GT2 family glycosyltransferase